MVSFLVCDRGSDWFAHDLIESVLITSLSEAICSLAFEPNARHTNDIAF